MQPWGREKVAQCRVILPQFDTTLDGPVDEASFLSESI